MITRTATTAIIAEPQPSTGILHPFPTAELAHLDPFVFLDTGAPRNLGDGEIYVGPHPHRGVQPVSLLFRGRIEHRDSLGNHREISSGGMHGSSPGREHSTRRSCMATTKACSTWLSSGSTCRRS